jgi:TRAP-type transport system small permease protein
MRPLGALLEWTAGLLLAVLVLVALLQVFARYTDAVFVPWTEELARLLFVWVIWIGAAAGLARGAHIRFELFVDRLRPARRRVVEAAVDVAVAVSLVVLIAYGWQVARSQKGTTFLTMPFSVQWTYLAAVVGAVVMLVGLVVRRIAGAER